MSKKCVILRNFYVINRFKKKYKKRQPIYKKKLWKMSNFTGKTFFYGIFLTPQLPENVSIFCVLFTVFSLNRVKNNQITEKDRTFTRKQKTLSF